jgi:hypothetical protein
MEQARGKARLDMPPRWRTDHPNALGEAPIPIAAYGALCYEPGGARNANGLRRAWTP